MRESRVYLMGMGMPDQRSRSFGGGWLPRCFRGLLVSADAGLPIACARFSSSFRARFRRVVVCVPEAFSALGVGYSRLWAVCLWRGEEPKVHHDQTTLRILQDSAPLRRRGASGRVLPCTSIMSGMTFPQVGALHLHLPYFKLLGHII